MFKMWGKLKGTSEQVSQTLFSLESLDDRQL